MRRALLALLPGIVWAHGGEPQVTRIAFTADGEPIAITDNQGIFAAAGQGFAWLCEDAFVAGEPVLGAARVGDRWLVGVGDGLFFSDDGGCTPHPIEGRLAGHIPARISVGPDAVLVATRSFGRRNDVYRSEDGGRSWRAAGVDTPFQIVELIRSEADPQRVYIAGAFGAARSDDGGRRFAPIGLGPAELAPNPVDFKLLGTSAADRDVVFAALESFPSTHLLRSSDGGASWRSVTTLDDFPVQFLHEWAGARALAYAQFAGVRRSADGGLTWGKPEDAPEARLGCLARAPDSDRVWACTNVFLGGAWAVGFSDDFGVSFVPALGDFTEAARWDCPEGTRAHACCGGLCAGLPPGGECADADPDLPAVCEATPIEPAPPEPDAGPLAPDAGVDAGPDAGADAGRDAGPDAAADADLTGPDAGPDIAPDLASPDAEADRGDTPTDARPDRPAVAVDAALDATPDARVRDARPPLEASFEVTPVLVDEGSGCGHAPGPAAWWAGLLALFQRRRRRRPSSAKASHQGADA